MTALVDYYFTRTAANPSNMPMLTTSVAVVRKILDAVAGSTPKRCIYNGTTAPQSPLMMQLTVMAGNTTTLSITVPDNCCELATRNILAAATAATSASLSKSSSTFSLPVHSYGWMAY